MASTWEKKTFTRENGEKVQMHFPIIVSASRSTDIPAFYSDWFFHRLKVGYSAWTNPFNGEKSFIAYEDTRFIVFWSKNPRPLLSHLPELKDRNIGCYIQYSLNDYEKEKLEVGVRPLQERIDTFKRLVDELGLGGVVWRFDPLMLTEDIHIDDLLSKIERIGDQLQGYTEKLVFSYADIELYRKVKKNLEKNNIPYREWDESNMLEFARLLSSLNKKWGYELATCAEKIDLENLGIQHNRCIDDKLIIRRGFNDRKLMNFLNVTLQPVDAVDLFGNPLPVHEDAILLPNETYAIRGKKRDSGQRKLCGCIASKDIGEYNTCIHLCEYCYANTSKESAKRNYSTHKANPFSETITGR